MNAGPLRGLAARALGLETPLRSQRAAGVNGPTSRGGADAQAGVAATATATTPARAWEPLLARYPSSLAPAAAAEGAPLALTAELRGAAPAGLARVGGVPPAPVKAAGPFIEPAFDREPAQAPARVDGTAAAAGPEPSSRAASASDADRALSSPHRLSAVPEPLLPMPVSAARIPTATAALAAALRRGAALSKASTDAPTEVHISIGRVELTALAPAASGRAPARREPPPGRSLADYLRGGPGDRKPT